MEETASDIFCGLDLKKKTFFTGALQLVIKYIFIGSKQYNEN